MLILPFIILKWWLVVFSAAASDEKLLIDHVRQQLQETDPVLRPVRNSSTPLNINAVISFNNLLELDERSQTVVLKIFMYTTWKNEYFSWNASDFGGRSGTYLPRSELWYPNLDTYTRVTNLKEGDAHHGDLWLFNDGTCGLLSSHVLTLFCKLDMRRYPFDKQTCSFSMSSWTYTTDELIYEATATLEFHERNSEFEMDGFDATLIAISGSGWMYPVIQLEVRFSRQPQFLINMMFVPIGILIMMSGVAFFLPPNTEAKADIQLSVILSVAVYSLIMSDQMPPSSRLPVAGDLLITILGLNLLALMFSIFTINLSTNQKHAPPHWLFKTCKRLRFLFCCHDLICCKSKNNAVDPDTIVKVKEFQEKNERIEISELTILTDFVKSFEEGQSISEQWQLVATILDRTYFLFMAIFITVLFVTFFDPVDM